MEHSEIENVNTKIKAIKEYKIADTYAREANQAAQLGNNALTLYKKLNTRLNDWKKIMAPTPIILFMVVFIMVSIGEYLISKEIYREFNDDIPWLIAIVFFVAGVFASEFLVYKLFKEKREWKRYEINRSRPHAIDDEIEASIQKTSNRSFVFGLIISVLLVAAIGFLSFKRVQVELIAERRTSGFGIMDIMPMLLFVVEIVSGVFIMYLIKRTVLGFKVKRLSNKFINYAKVCNEKTSIAIRKFGDAERLGYSPLNSDEYTISDNLHTAFYRNNTLAIDDKERYIELPKKMSDELHIKLINKKGSPLIKHIAVLTAYKYQESGGTNSKGLLSFKFESTYKQDSAKTIRIYDSGESVNYKKIVGNYDLHQEKDNPHVIIVED